MKRVLLVDDDDNFLQSLIDGLAGIADNKFTTVTANNGREAVNILNSSTVDLVVTDLKMPEMDGFELLTYMSGRHDDIPVIVMTAFGTPEIQNKVDEMGALQYIEKPVELEDIASKIENGLQAGEKGAVSGVGTLSFMQLIGMENKTCTLTIRSGDRKGMVFFQQGEPVNAFTDPLEGMEAMLEIASWDSVEITIQNFCRRKKKVIEAPLGFILMESARKKDEAQEKQATPDAAQASPEPREFEGPSPFEADIPTENLDLSEIGDYSESEEEEPVEEKAEFDAEKEMKEGELASIFTGLQEALAQAIGPIAGMIMRENLENWGNEGPAEKDRLPRLIESLALEIDEEEDKVSFQTEAEKIIRTRT